jgi:ketosteroid isomerase-like protein
MTNAGEVARAFITAVAGGDLATARALLAPDVRFVGPFDTFEGPEPYLAALQGLHSIVAGVEIRRVFTDGDEACVLYDLTTTAPAAAVSFVSEWMHVEGGRIAQVRAVFDARPFAALFGAG